MFSIQKITDVRDIKLTDEKVRVKGWIHRIRQQGKKMAFLYFRDGTGNVQVLLGKDVLNEDNSRLLKKEASIDIEGTIKVDKRAPEGYEIHGTYFNIIGTSEGIDEINTESGVHCKYNHRHLVLRENRTTSILKLRHYLLKYLRDFFDTERCYEVTPPTITQQECEGGSNLFKFKYYEEEASLTQSSQLYLETVIPIMKRAYCILPSYRAEKSTTRRHLSEFTHVEAEFGMINFDDLLDIMERMIKYVYKACLGNVEAKGLIEYLNPDFKLDTQEQFVKMKYSDAIIYLKDNGIYKDEEAGTFYEYGDDIHELPERKMIDKIGKPVFLTGFPYKMKAFYMEKDPDNKDITLSADLLVPQVGEIIGSSMRMWDYKELMDSYTSNGIDPINYSWYNDQRKYGSCPHGGFGLGLERLLLWLVGDSADSVKDCCLYPRYVDRCKP